MRKPEFDLCVIGGGSAGLVAAAGAAQLGAKVVLLEKHALGGDCLYTGCVPSKALLHCARVAHTVQTAASCGIAAPPPNIDLASCLRRVSAVIGILAVHDSPEHFRAMGIDVIFGSGCFTDPRTFVINGHALTAKHFVLATGSRPATPAIEGLESVPYLTNETLFSLTGPVPSLIILGGGPIALEMAQAFVRLGSMVQVVQRGKQILSREDPDVAGCVQSRLSAEGVQFYVGHTTLRIAGSAGDIRCTIESPAGAHTLQATHLLVATGRQINVEGLGLASAKIHIANGRLVLSPRLRTTNPSVYACGDITNRHQFTHTAEHEAGVVLRNTLFHWPAKVEERVVPWCTFTDPEVARVGLSETEAKARRVKHEIYTFPFKDIDRAQTDNVTAGFAKIITQPNGRLLGATLCGTNAGELIHEYVLALSQNLDVAAISNVIHIYPTLAQINKRVADMRRRQNLTPTARRWIKRIFRLRGT